MAFEFLDSNSAPEITENLRRLKKSTTHVLTFCASSGNPVYSSNLVIDGARYWISDTAEIPYFMHYSLTPYGEPYSGFLTVDDNINVYAVCDDKCDIILNFEGYTMTVDGTDYSDTYTAHGIINNDFRLYDYYPNVASTQLFAGWIDSYNCIDNYYHVYPYDKTTTYTARVVDRKEKVTVNFSCNGVSWADGTTSDKVIEFDFMHSFSNTQELCEAPNPPEGKTADDFLGWRLMSADNAVTYGDGTLQLVEDCVAYPIWEQKEGV